MIVPPPDQSRWRRRLWAAILALGTSLSHSAASAHPHVFVEHTITVLVNADGLEGFRLAWTFDEMFSSMIVLTFDANKDKSLSAPEVKAIEQKHFANLKDFNYFVHLRVNDKPVVVTSVKDFQVKMAGGQVVYEFIIPIKATEGTLEVAVDDPTYYSAFTLSERSPVQVQSARNYRVDCRVAKDAGELNQIVKCTFKRQGP